MKSSFSWVEATVVLVVIALGAAFFAPALFKAKERSGGPRCKNQLRQIGLAAIHYSDDLRFLPHVTRLQELDGDFQDAGPTSTTKSLRALMWHGYLDRPETLICGSSDYGWRPIESELTKGNMRYWFWGGDHERGNPGLTPFVDGLPDPSVEQVEDLSYGWTRKGMNRNTRASSILAADRAVRIESEFSQAPPGRAGWRGNHADGWHVLFADASTEWVAHSSTFRNAAPADMLAATANSADGFLAIRDQSQALGAAAQAAAAQAAAAQAPARSPPAPSPSPQGR
jgi:hypothetical protein